jgi:glycosyltransferase involved in cell wall biosynthesis
MVDPCSSGLEPAPPYPKVSIILPCRNEAAHVDRCLSDILAQLFPADQFEVIVADGMSSDGTRDILDGWLKKVRSDGASVISAATQAVCIRPRLRMIDNPQRVVSTGVNTAIRAAQGETIVRIDAHTEYSPDYIQKCIEVLNQTGADNVGGPCRTKADKYLQRAIAAAYHSPFSVGGARFHDPEYEGYVDTVTYGCWRKETFEKFGYFDEELVRNQDDEHNLRIIRGGGKIWQSP